MKVNVNWNVSQLVCRDTVSMACGNIMSHDCAIAHIAVTFLLAYQLTTVTFP